MARKLKTRTGEHVSVEKYLHSLAEEIEATANLLRKYILQAVPNAIERAYPGSKLTGHRVADKTGG